MNIIKTILNEKNNVLYEKNIEIQSKSDELIKKAYEINDEIQQNIVLANIYFLKTICNLEFDDASEACKYFEKIPFKCLTEESIKNYILCLKLSYQFKKVVDILLGLMVVPQPFELQYYCLHELVDDAMVVDGALTKEKYFEYKTQLKELLKNEYKSIEKSIP